MEAQVMEAANLKKRMVRLCTKFHRRMTDDKRLNDISGYIDSIESTIDSILHDLLVSSNTPIVAAKPEEVSPPPVEKAPVKKKAVKKKPAPKKKAK